MRQAPHPADPAVPVAARCRHRGAAARAPEAPAARRRRSKKAKVAMRRRGRPRAGALRGRRPGIHRAGRGAAGVRARGAQLGAGGARLRRPEEAAVLGKRYGVPHPRLLRRIRRVARPAARSTRSTSRCPTHAPRVHGAAARHGVHVLCEKPLAASELDCRAMIEACERGRREADDGLSPALRARQPRGDRSGAQRQDRRAAAVHLDVLQPGRGRQHPPRRASSAAARSTTSASTASTPRATFSTPSRSRCTRPTVHGADPRFREVEESHLVRAALPRRPARLVHRAASAPTRRSSSRWSAPRARSQLDMAYEISAEKTLTVARATKKKSRTFAKTDQFAPELLHFSECIARGTRARSRPARKGCATCA